jgi:hypothetical protein
MDARRVQHRTLTRTQAAQNLRTRHYFQWKHRRIFLPIALAATASALVLVLHFMPLVARERDSVLAAAAVLYFGSVHLPKQNRIFVPKELLVAILFTLACEITTWTRSPSHRTMLLLSAFCFIALAWLNCYAIESWESQSRRQHKVVLRLGSLLSCFMLLTAIVTAEFSHPREAALLAAASLSAALLALLDQRRDCLTPMALRTAADLVLLTPLALLVLH